MATGQRSADAQARVAVPADVTVLVELRAEMFRAMGNADVDDTGWRRSAQDWFRAHIESAAVHIVVVEVDRQVVSTAMAAIRDSAPSPTCPAGGDVLISNVCTLPAARRRGHGQLAFTAALGWARSTGVARAELMATGDGQTMYETAGFTATDHTAMRMPLLQQPG